VYEKDLGTSTPGIAKAMKTYDPGAGWRKAEELSEAAVNN
jgi:hypothetical protein